MNIPGGSQVVRGELETYIPITLDDLTSGLLAEKALSEERNRLFRHFCKVYIALYHAKFFARLQLLKRCYAPFSPDSTTLALHDYSAEDLNRLQKTLIDEITGIIEKANYTRITEAELNRVLSETSPYGLQVSIDFDDFDEVHLYYRGLGTQTERKRSWRSLFLKAEEISVPIYRRLFVVLKFKERPTQAPPLSLFDDPRQFLRDKWRRLFEFKLIGSGTEPFIYLKLFKDIPRSDLEMLFPNTRVELRSVDKVTMSVSGGGGIIGGILAVGAKILRAANPSTIFFAIAGFIGILWRETSKVLASRNRYIATLAKSLYFHNLDNNLGVLSNLIELATEEECKEAILGYYFLLKAGEKGCGRDELDEQVERYLLDTYGIRVNFDLTDGITKLDEAGLLIKAPERNLNAVGLKQAVELLDREWDSMFVFGE